MATNVITPTDDATEAAQHARTRALIVPREHGAWGLLFVPLISGAAVGIATTGMNASVVLLAVLALALFWLRTPAESLLGTTPMKAQGREERRTVWSVVLALGVVAIACLAGLLWGGRNLALLPLGGIAALLFFAQTALMSRGRKLRMTAQLIGAAGLTSTAAAAYYVAVGRLDHRALLLWVANWIFAANQVHFVQLRIHAARAANFAEKFARGRFFFFSQIALVAILAAGVSSRWFPLLPTLAFLPVLARGFNWFVARPQPLQVRSLGWSEMKQGIAFGILLVAGIVLS
jgi:hypothetical protein